MGGFEKMGDIEDTVDWEKYRKQDGSIDLYKVWEQNSINEGDAKIEKFAHLYFRLIELHQPIVSRQAAAVALTTAHALVEIILKMHADNPTT